MPNTILLPVSPENIARAAAVVRAGGLVAFPTETVYGLGSSALDPLAAAKIYAAKGRPSDNPLIVHIAEAEAAELYACTTPLYYKLAEVFMPGPLTLILRKRDNIPQTVTGGLNSVGLRVPSGLTAHDLIAAAGLPICAPSANTSGSPSPTRAEHVMHDLDGKIDMVLDGGLCEVGLESTIVKLDTEDGIPILLRPGKITLEQLRAIAPDIRVDESVHGAAASAAPLAPGMSYRHYAPRAELILIKGSPGETARALAEIEAQGREDTIVLRLGDSPEARMRSLYDALRAADMPHINRIYTAEPDREREEALYNRMVRAARG